MANKKTPVTAVTEEIVEEVEEVEETTPEVDPLQPQPNDTSAVLAYKRLIADYKTKNPLKFEAKKEGFLKKLQGTITMEEVHGANGKLSRRTFQVPNIQTKRVR
jgi:hypothetical protein